MSNFKGHSYSAVSGDSMWYPQEKGFTPTFWGRGWNAMEGKEGHGSQEKSDSKMNMKGKAGMGKRKMSGKMGACPFCG